LVPGVAVFGYLSWPLTREWHARWLANSRVTTRFLKPAYDGETITVTSKATSDTTRFVECCNASGTSLATLECTLDPPDVSVDNRAHLRFPESPEDRVQIDWESVVIDRPFALYRWEPDSPHNRDYAERVDDFTGEFQHGTLHPHTILAQANKALVRRFIMPAWIHTGSEIQFRKALRVGDIVDVKAVPIEKWERKGHQFIKLYIAFVVGDEVATEIYHTAIFRVADK
jgi:acyl dehydratase